MKTKNTKAGFVALAEHAGWWFAYRLGEAVYDRQRSPQLYARYHTISPAASLKYFIDEAKQQGVWNAAMRQRIRSGANAGLNRGRKDYPKGKKPTATADAENLFWHDETKSLQQRVSV